MGRVKDLLPITMTVSLSGRRNAPIPSLSVRNFCFPARSEIPTYKWGFFFFASTKRWYMAELNAKYLLSSSLPSEQDEEGSPSQAVFTQH